MKEYSEKYRIDTEEKPQHSGRSSERSAEVRTSVSVAGRKFLLSRRRWNALEGQKPGDMDHQPYGTCVLSGAVSRHPGSGELADAGLKGLRGELHDTEHGGWYAGLTADGNIVHTKQCLCPCVCDSRGVFCAACRAAGEQRNFWTRRWRFMICGSGTKRKDFPVTPGIPGSRFWMITGV